MSVSRFIRERPVAALWAAVAIVLIGRLVDLQWHLTHDEFEGVSQQFRAHTVVWIGVLSVLAVTAAQVRAGVRMAGCRVALAGALLYVPVAVWHFIGHGNGSDPEVAHVLLAIADVTIVVGAIIALIDHRRQPSPRIHPAGLSE